MGTPVGGGFRSLNVTLRQNLDLYACIRPVQYIPGVPSPLKDPGKGRYGRLPGKYGRSLRRDRVAFPERPKRRKVIEFLNHEMGQKIRTDSAIGIKPMSPFNSKRLIRKAIQWALDHQRPECDPGAQGKHPEIHGGRRSGTGGMNLPGKNFREKRLRKPILRPRANAHGKVVIKDRLADAMFQQILLRPEEYSVLAMPNLNGDYMSDALAAEVGGLGMAPGANVGDGLAVFEATHGTAPKYAGQDSGQPRRSDPFGGLHV